MMASIVPFSSATCISSVLTLKKGHFTKLVLVLTWKLERLLKVVEDILGENAEPIIMFQQDDLWPLRDINRPL